MVLVPPCGSSFASLLFFLSSSLGRCGVIEATEAAACGGWERLEFGSRLYSPSSFMAGGRWGNKEGYVEGCDATQARV
jgi:hypothetical protein